MPCSSGELKTRDSNSRWATEQCSEIGRAHRLNSSHRCISYAVFCLKKKKKRELKRRRELFAYITDAALRYATDHQQIFEPMRARHTMHEPSVMDEHFIVN